MATVRGVQPSTERPFFRYDLETVQVEENGHRFVDVADPTTGSRFRFYEVEYAVACGMDGQRDLAGLTAWAEEELGLDTNPDELRRVVETLAELGYLGGAAEAAVERQGRAEKPTAPGAAAEAAVERQGRAEKPTAPGAAAEAAVERQGRPEKPTAPGAAAEEAAAARRAAEPAADDDLALGTAGRSPLEPERPAMPKAADLELGFAGGNADESVPAEPAAESADLELGFAGAPSEDAAASSAPRRRARMSTNLGDHMDVGTEDVKEAVRQSRVMAAVAPPEELELEADEPEDSADAGKKETVRMREADAAELAAEAAALGAAKEAAVAKAEAKAKAEEARAAAADEAAAAKAKAEEARAAAADAAAAAKADGKVKAEEARAEAAETKAQAKAKKKPEPVAAAAVEPKRPERRSSVGLVLWLVLLAAAAGGAWYYYTEFVAEREPAPPVTPEVPETAQVQPEPPPPPPTAVLAAGEPPSAEAAAAQAGKVAWVATAGTEVAAGDVVAKLAGFERFERAYAEDEKSRDRYQNRLDAATAKGNKRAMARFQADVERKNRDMAEVQAKLDAFLIEAPIEGVAEPLVEVGAQVEAEASVVRVTGEAGPTATFAVPTGDYQEGDEVAIAAEDDPGLTATCTVTGTAPGKISVECPVDSGLGDGASVVLRAQQ